MKKIFRTLIITLFSATLLGLNQNPASKATPEVWVNIFIHGIVRPVVNVGDMVNIARQKIKQSRYKHVTRYMRKHNVIHRSQATQDVGLMPIKMEPNPNSNGPRAMVAIFKKINQLTGNTNAKELYYTFGWSGLLSYSSRQKAANLLYNKLVRLVAQLKKEGFAPRIRIVAFSHGGNVAIQMANFDHWSKLKSKLSIAELINLGVPVHKENDVLIRHPMFKKVYHFYSEGDIPQSLDFVSTDYTVSHRRYSARRCVTIPDKLTQIQVRFSKTIERKAPFTPANKYRTLTTDPNHISMWSFGWTPSGYDKNLPIFPLPTAALTPYLVHVIKTHPQLGRNLEMDVYPHQEKITITDRKWRDHHKIQEIIIPFMSQAAFNDLKQTAWTRRPADAVDITGKTVVTDAIYFATRQRKLQKHCSKTLDCRSKNCTASCACAVT